MIEIVEVDLQDKIILNPVLDHSHLNIFLMTDKLLEKIFLKLKNDPIFMKIFSPQFISYDIIYNSVQIDNSAFPFRYSSFKQLLIDFLKFYKFIQ